MVKHIVMFKLKESLSENEKIEIMNNFKSAIEALPQTIKFIKDMVHPTFGVITLYD